jgi:DNA polymerase
MLELDDKYNQLLFDVETYLQQQQELFNDVFYTGDLENMKRKRPEIQAEKSESQNVISEDWHSTTIMDELQTKICNCTKCPLGFTRKKFVFGTGNKNANIMFIGEAPGADEDEQGEPFVGRAGQLLNKILEAIEFKREDVFICNILKCRPPNNRDPLPSEVDECIPYLWKQIEIVQPKIIVSLGRIAAQMLLNTNDSLTKLREKVQHYRGVPMIVTYHPAALLRNPNWKRPTWEDMKLLRKMYNELSITNG